MADLSTTFTLNGIVGYVYDDVHDVLYLTVGDEVRRWSPLTQTFDTAITVSPHLGDIDISADGSFLLVADYDTTVVSGQRNAIIHRIDLSGAPSIEDLHFVVDYAGLERGAYDVAIAGDVGLVTTNFAGSGWTPFRSFDSDAANPTFELVDGMTQVRQSTYLIPSEDNRYVLVLESNISDAPMAIYDSVTNSVIASSSVYNFGVSGFNWGKSDINAERGLVVQTIYNNVFVLDFDLELVRNLSSLTGAGRITGAHFSDNGNQLFLWDVAADDILVYDTHSWKKVATLDVTTDQFSGGNNDPAGTMAVSGDGRFLFLQTNHGIELIDLAARLQINSVGNGLGNALYGGVGLDNLAGGAGNDTLLGDAGADVLDGGADFDFVSYVGSSAVSVNLGSNMVSGGDAAGDTIINFEGAIGSDFNDTLIGNGVANTLIGGAGGDVLFGGGGDDTASYAGSSGAVDVNLKTGAASGGDAAGDTFHSIENLIGSSFGDTLAGNGVANAFNGGRGNDTVSYLYSTGAVFIDLGAGSASGGIAIGDTFFSIENLRGSNFNDTLTGDATANALSGGKGSDTLFGADGDDTLEGGLGADALHGGDGVDMASYAESNVRVIVNLGAGASAGGHAIGDTFDSIENVLGSKFDDTLIGNAAANVLTGGKGADILRGGDGADTLEGGLGADVLQGGDGVDTVSYAGSNVRVRVNLGAGTAVGGHAIGDSFDSVESVVGSAFDDQLTGDAGVNRLNGGAGADLLDGGAGDDIMIGGAGNDLFVVDSAGDIVVEAPNGGVDTVRASVGFTILGYVEALILTGAAAIDGAGNAFDNTITGNSAANRLSGLGGQDALYGGDGDDILIGGYGGDMLFGGAGIDTASYVTSFEGVQVELLSGAVFSGEAVGDWLDQIENLTGSNFDDYLRGDDGANVLNGRLGADNLTGGEGADAFVFDVAGVADLIGDFQHDTDKIRIDNSAFTALGPDGVLAAAAFVLGTGAQDGDDRIIYDATLGKLYYDADGSGAGVQVELCTLSNTPTVSNTDIVVI